jgi:hypothetical protein
MAWSALILSPLQVAFALHYRQSQASRIVGGSMTFDWQILIAAAGAISLRLVASGSNVVRALDEQLQQSREEGFYSLQNQVSQANDCYGPDRSDLKFPIQQ